jgi:aldose 1-epimerase
MTARLILSLLFIGVFGMSQSSLQAAESLGPETFGKTKDGSAVERFELRGGGVTAKIISRGATLTELHAPDRNGKTVDVALGFDDVAGYESDANQSFGCTTGRVCNRIAKGRFTLGGKTYQLAINNEPNHLHGGPKRSLAQVVWRGEPIKTAHGPGVKFTYTSPDGEEGYPGNVDFTTTYAINDRGELRIDWTATTDQATPINLTNHTYFNLAGHGSPSVLDHRLWLVAEHYTPVDATLIPTGKLDPVAGLPIDFYSSTDMRIGDRIAQLDDAPTQGYDHNFVVKVLPGSSGLNEAATLSEPVSGRVLSVYTTQPGVQLYTGNFLHGQKGKGGATYARRSALCLETQHFPDSVNHENFPTVILQPGKQYHETCVYALSAE